MAKVICPFFSTFATGSYGKSITVRYLSNLKVFVMSVYRRYPGKRHAIQDENAQIFKERMKALAIANKAVIE